MIKNCYRIFFVLFITAAMLNAKVTVKISGTITEKTSGDALPGANVFIQDTFLGASSDENGFFEINGITPGNYVLRVSFMGFKPVRRQISISPDQDLVMNFELEETTILTEQIVITSSRQPENLASAAASISVLEKSDIQRRNSYKLDEALLSVPGVTLVGENINIRGGSGYNRLGGSRTLVLLDGIPILTSDLGAVNWNIIPVTEVEHMEVLKGAASSLYGSGAISGVVNILTKLPSKGHSLSFRQSSGLYDEPSVPEWKWTDKLRYFHRTDASYSNSIGPVGMRLAVSHHQSTGDRENGLLERWYYTGKLHWQLPDHSTLTLFSTYSQEDREFFLQWWEQDHALNVPPPERGNRYQLDGFVSYAVYHKLFSPTLSTKLRVSYNQQLVGIPINVANAFTPAIGLSGEVQINWKPHPNHSISAGVDYKRDQVESLYYGGREANGISPYIQEIWKLSELLQLNAGVRLDTYTLVGDSVEQQISPKIGASWQPIFGTIFHFSCGRAFRAATVVERFISAGSKDFKALPNPTLKPERSALFDLGVRQNIGERAFAEVTAFSADYENLIEPVLNIDLTAQFINFSRARIQGVETMFRWDVIPQYFRLLTTATWMDPRDIDRKEPLLYRPRFIGYFSPSLSFGAFSLEADYRYMSRLEKVAVFPLDERVPTKVWDIRLMYKWKNYKLQFDIRNALNYNYTVSERVLGEIRNYALTLSGDI
ncbi:TonB-dependent receptor [candidate division KSB1 bacterium]|nr:TonB-dependent receptor [candidate division KSB1 bacterium]